MYYLIIANGDFLAKDIILQAMQNRILVALDGAANKLANLNIKPDVIVGDFDSMPPDNQWGIHTTFAAMTEDEPPYIGNQNVKIVPVKNQLLTDLGKAIHYCDQHDATSIHIICALGGRLDHHEGNLRSLRAEYKKDREIILHSEQQSVRFLKNERVCFSGEAGDACGVIAFPHASMSSEGLEYEYKNVELVFGFTENTCNALRTSSATVTVDGEALLFMPPYFSAQREFSALTGVEKLLRLLSDFDNNPA